MSDFACADHPRDPDGRFTARVANEASVHLSEPHTAPTHTEPWAPLTHPSLEVIDHVSTPNDSDPENFADDETFTYLVTGRMRADVLAAAKLHVVDDVPVTLVTTEAETGTDSTREAYFDIEVYVGAGKNRRRVFDSDDCGPNGALAKLLRWIDT